MHARLTLLALGCSIWAIGCNEWLSQTRSPDIQEIIDNLIMAGFPANDIAVVAGRVYVGRDAEVSLAASREMLQVGDDSEEQYRTTNLVDVASVTRICVDGGTFTEPFSTGLSRALASYNGLGLRFTMGIPNSGCSFTINAMIQHGLNGGASGFPSNGLPFGTIHIGDAITPLTVNLIQHVIMHEIGHTIGLRHSDYYNRSISCGSGGNEGDGGVGAIFIPGTPSVATVGGSLMNSCFRSNETGAFTQSDIVALKTLYAPPCDNAACDNQCNRSGFCEGACDGVICRCRMPRPCP